MLVLTRKVEQSIVVGGAAGIEPVLKITVLEIKNGSVRLGIEAEASVTVHRWEVWKRILAGSGADASVEGLSVPVMESCLKARGFQESRLV